MTIFRDAPAGLVASGVFVLGLFDAAGTGKAAGYPIREMRTRFRELELPA